MNLKSEKERIINRLREEYTIKSSMLADLESDIDKLKEVKKHAQSFGDLRENAAYVTAKEDLELARIRVNDLMEWMEAYSEFMDFLETVKDNYTKDQVQKGSCVLLESKLFEPEVFLIVPEEIEDASIGLCSTKSPCGKEMLYKNVGDTIVVYVTTKKEYTIKDIV